MGWKDLLLRFRALRSRTDAERDLDDELKFHLDMEAAKMRHGGLSDDDARRAARANFGGLDRAQEECRDARGLTAGENLARDLRYGARMLRKSPVFTTVAVLSLAIGIGANTAVFSLVDAVLLRMLPVKNPEQLVVLKWGSRKASNLNFNFTNGGRDARGRSIRNTFSWQIFDRFRAASKTLDAVIAFAPLPRLSIVAGGQAIVTGGQTVTGNYFTGLGAEMAVGRPFTNDDETADGVPPVVVSYRFWERFLGLDPSAIGRMITVNTIPCVVVGVTRKGFVGVAPGGFILTPEVDVSVPIRLRERIEVSSNSRRELFGDKSFWVQMIGRRGERGSDAAIEAELASAIAENLPEQARKEAAANPPYVSAEPGGQGLDNLRERYRNPLLVILAVVGLTLLMACANLAGLLLARSTARRKEILVRLALGAKRWRLIRQLLAEGAILSGAGAAAGMLIAYAGVRGLLALVASGNTPVALDISPDVRILAFTIAVSLFTTFVFALAPAIRATRVNIAQDLKHDTPASSGQRFGAIRGLVAAQIAVAVLLTTGALLAERTLLSLKSVPLGFNRRNLALFDIAPARNGYDEARSLHLYARVTDRLRQTPGVSGVTLAGQRLISGWVSNGPVLVDGVTEQVSAHFNFVGPDFLEVMQVPLAAGRSLTTRDMTATPRVAVVNETFAKKYLGAGSPLGRRFRWEFKKEWEVEIVGVSKDARYDRLRNEIPATIYAPIRSGRSDGPNNSPCRRG
jgi:predicted permease